MSPRADFFEISTVSCSFYIHILCDNYTLFHHKPQGMPSLTCQKHHACISFTLHMCACSIFPPASRIDISAPRPLLAVGITSELRSPNGNRRENIFATGAAALRTFPRVRESRRSSRRGTASQARRRRRSRCRGPPQTPLMVSAMDERQSCETTQSGISSELMHKQGAQRLSRQQ